VSRAPRVVIADEQPTIRATVRRLLARDGFEVCGEAADADAAVEAALRERPDICLIGVVMPGSGIRATRRIAPALPETAIVILTASESRDDLVGAIKAGAVGYLLKSEKQEELPSILRGVLAGEAAIPRKLVAPLVRELQNHGRRRAIVGERGSAELTAREWEVMELTCDGLDTAEIAERLLVSPVTVRRHVSGILKKLGVKDRDAAVTLVQEQGLSTLNIRRS
jgi:DNA-binding NarL/FixJ family response regulator